MLVSLIRLHRIVVPLLLLILVPVVHAEKDADLELFDGGKMDGLFLFRSSLLTGAGVHGALSGMTAPMSPGPFIIFGNPASLGHVDGRRIVFSLSPQFDFQLSALTDLDNTVSEEVDKTLLESFNEVGPRIDPEADGTIGRHGAIISGFAASFSLDGEGASDEWFGSIPRLVDRIGFGYYQPLVIHAGMTYNGLRMRLRTIANTPSEEILLYAVINTDARIQITSDSWTIAAAKKIDKFWLGVGIMRTDAAIEIAANQRTDGIMSLASSESAFNDTTDPWQNDLFNWAHGRFEGSSVAIKLGATYKPSEKFLLGFDYRLQGGLDMDGSLDIALNRFPALKTSVEEGEKRFDVNRIERATELTRTYPKVVETTTTLEASIPSALSLAISYAGPLKPNLTFIKYFGEFSYKYTMIEDSAEFHYKRGFKPDWSFLLGLDIGLKMSIGAASVQDVIEGYHDANNVPIKESEAQIVPRLGIGFDASLTDALTLGVMVFGLPEDVLRFTLDYRF